MTPKGKSKPKNGEVGEGTKDILTRCKFDLKMPEDILKTAPSQPTSVYSALVEEWLRMGIRQTAY